MLLYLRPALSQGEQLPTNLSLQHFTPTSSMAGLEIPPEQEEWCSVTELGKNQHSELVSPSLSRVQALSQDVTTTGTAQKRSVRPGQDPGASSAAGNSLWLGYVTVLPLLLHFTSHLQTANEPLVLGKRD